MSNESAYDPENFFKLKKPCENCPFRADAAAIPLEPGRLQHIIERLVYQDGGTFHCHKTAYHPKLKGTWESGRYVASGNESMCAGAMIYLEKISRPTVAMRIGVLTGLYDPEVMRAQMDAVVEVKKIRPRSEFDIDELAPKRNLSARGGEI
ncbi:hypothetical protein AB4Y45_35650 [Paraburkholderia sp. EG287A]|uniref:hypothetical protein n=1 Tax=Paraburkholderia sp. EG287A TaxID=3237012 RepID=UPI0034D3707F